MNTTTKRFAMCNRVLIVDNQAIMGAGLEQLLSGSQVIEVSGITMQNERALVEMVWQVQPDTIILILESQCISPGRLFDLLQNYGRLRIILVSANSNVIEVFDRQQIMTIDHVALLDQLIVGQSFER